MGQFDDRERARVGDQAEVYVRQVISNHGEGALLRGPLLPITNSNNQIERYRESDFLVYTQGTVFCIEVKNYSGIIGYLPLYQNQQIWNGSFSTSMNVFSGYDDSSIAYLRFHVLPFLFLSGSNRSHDAYASEMGASQATLLATLK